MGHFKAIGDEFGPVDLAIMENGQATRTGKYIHMMPDETAQAADDLRARAVLPGHAGRFVLAKHSWNCIKRLALSPAKEGPGVCRCHLCRASRCGSPIRHNHLTPGGAKRQCSIRGDMTISAQVIDTIVEWIDNLHQPLHIDDIARHTGYSKWHLQRLFYSTKGESLGAIFAKGSAAGRPRSARHRSAGLRYLPQVWQIRRPLPASLPDLQSAAGAAKRSSQSRPLRRPLWFTTLEENQRRHTSAAPDAQWRPSAKNHRQNSTV